MSATMEIWLAAGYAAFLVAASAALRRLARRTALGPRVPWLGIREAEAPETFWPHSDRARFERGISRVLEVLALFILAVTAVRHGLASPVPLGALTVAAVVMERRRIASWVRQARRRRREEAP